MNWKRYREFFENSKMSEDHFVLGIDMGAATSSISYFDPIRRAAEVLDISGGYGKASAPTALQYISDTREWIFGEYAILNVDGVEPGDGALLTDFAAKLGSGEYVDIGAGAKSPVDIAAVYLKELVANCRNINPKAQIVGIVATLPDFAGQEVKNAMGAAFRAAGFERVLIELISERRALLAHYFHEKMSVKNERLLLLDFGARGLKGAIFDVSAAAGGLEVKCAAAMTSDAAALGTSAVDDAILGLLADYYCKEQNIAPDKLSRQQRQQLFTFAHQHKDMLLGAGDAAAPIKLYFNFTYPPFSAAVSQAALDGIVSRYGQKMVEFIRDLAAKAAGGQRDFDAVICTGGGFEMPWAKKRILSLFGRERARIYKNSKSVLSEGATYIAAARLGLLAQIPFEIEDGHKAPCDIGIKIMHGGKPRFHPILERNRPLWQAPRTAYAILQGEGAARAITIYKRDKNGEVARLGEARLAGFPPRPAGTTRVAIDISSQARGYTITIKDLGFGEIFPASGAYERIEVSV